MADIIKRKKREYLIDASFEIETDKGIEVLPLKITNYEYMKAKDLLENNKIDEVVEYVKTVIYKMDKDVVVDPEEILLSFRTIAEYILKKSPR